MTGGDAPSFPEERFAIAVSGGGDSLGMLALALEAAPERFTVLTVDHALRQGSADDAAYVAEMCAARGVPCEILTLDWPEGAPTSNIQGAAREARYAAMTSACMRLGIDSLCTAHHADDQAETLLMRLARGSGLSGLSAIRGCVSLSANEGDTPVTFPSRRDNGSGVKSVTLSRPCLRLCSRDLHAAAHAAGFQPREDPANSDPRHDRTHARRWLAEHPDLDAARLAESAAHLAEADAAVEWLVDLSLDSRVERAGDTARFDHEGLPAEVKRRVLVRLAGPHIRGSDAAAAVRRLSRGESASIGDSDIESGRFWTLRPSGRKP